VWQADWVGSFAQIIFHDAPFIPSP
jgi:hypothetical protein